MRFFTSDQHYFHRNIIGYCERPFTSVDEMNATMIDRHNETVGPADTVWHLGDFTLGQDLSILKRLNGQHHLVYGNHDRCFPKNKKARGASEEQRKRYYDAGFLSVQDAVELQFEGYGPVWCHHMPLFDPAEDRRYQDGRPRLGHGTLLHGHIHEKRKGKVTGMVVQLNVGVDVWDFRPVSEADLVTELLRLKAEKKP